MLAKQYRLPRSVSFSNAKSVHTPYFRIVAKVNGLSYNRFGFVVSKKIDKRAVVRNRLRRVLRESVRSCLASKPGRDILFVVKQPFQKAKTSTISSLVQSSLEKLL